MLAEGRAQVIQKGCHSGVRCSGLLDSRVWFKISALTAIGEHLLASKTALPPRLSWQVQLCLHLHPSHTLPEGHNGPHVATQLCTALALPQDTHSTRPITPSPLQPTRRRAGRARSMCAACPLQWLQEQRVPPHHHLAAGCTSHWHLTPQHGTEGVVCGHVRTCAQTQHSSISSREQSGMRC